VEETLIAKTSMEIVMSEDLKQRLLAIAPRTGKTVEEFVQEALYTYVEDYEDGLAAEEALKSAQTTITLSEMRKELALDRRDLEYSKKTA